MNKPNHTQIVKIWEADLSSNGYRITRPLHAILEVIASSTRPLSPIEIYDQACQKNPGIGLVTVYRTIEKMEKLNFLEHVHHINECQTVFRSAQDHKHLLICTNCGQGRYFEGLEIEKDFMEIARQNGYRITGHWLQLSGLCEDCQN